jgi:multidrug efflux pump subunit AcrA (membrane-fusion protein)
MTTWRAKLHLIVVVIAVMTLGGCASNLPTETTVPLKEDEAKTRGALAFAGAPGKMITRTNSRGGAVDGFYLDQAQEKQIGLRLETVQVHPLKKKMEFSSTVEAPFEHAGVVTSVVHGVVTKVLADLGETVKAGQTLAYISSPDISEAQSNYLNAVAKV